MAAAIQWIAGTGGSTSARAQDASAAPTTATTRPEDELPANSPIRQWFTRLADPDPRVRDQARFDLMGLSGTDLRKLRQLVIESQPILPGQCAALRDIVMQAYLAGEKYSIRTQTGEVDETDPSGTEGPFFLGITWPVDYENEEIRLGATIDERLPGFPSYRYLKKGDMIMGVFIDAKAPLLQYPNMATPTRKALQDAIKGPQGEARNQNIVLQVLRDGEVLRIAVRMAPKPLETDNLAPGSIPAFKAARAERANVYWQENFAPLLESNADTAD